MMYNNKLVAVIKVNGKVLRENKDVVYIPFGSEYTIQLKNLHTTKAVVSIDIDGENVTDGSRYIIEPNQTVEIEGFLRGNNVSHKFKFIEKTQEISNFRGDNMEDGLIKITFQFESDLSTFVGLMRKSYDGSSHDGSVCSDLAWQRDRLYKDINHEWHNTDQQVYGSTVRATNNICSTNDNGITARGGQSNQSFMDGKVGVLESSVHTMIIQLKGDTGNQYIQKPVTVKTKIQCENCGRRWRSSYKCCGNCGTSLIM